MTKNSQNLSLVKFEQVFKGSFLHIYYDSQSVFLFIHQRKRRPVRHLKYCRFEVSRTTCSRPHFFPPAKYGALPRAAVVHVFRQSAFLTQSHTACGSCAHRQGPCCAGRAKICACAAICDTIASLSMHRAASVGPGYFSPPTARPTGPGRGPRPVPDKDAVCGPLRDARVHRPDPHGGEMEGRGGWGGTVSLPCFNPSKVGTSPGWFYRPIPPSINQKKKRTAEGFSVQIWTKRLIYLLFLLLFCNTLRCHKMAPKLCIVHER